MKPLPASVALDAYFLEARCTLLDLAGVLDRIQRGAGAEHVLTDPRLEKIRTALRILAGETGDRAEAIQKLFSLEYDPAWPIPAPK